MRMIGVIIGYVTVFLAGIAMFAFWFAAMTKWLGFLGSVLAFILCPGVIIFPIVFWIVEGLRR